MIADALPFWERARGGGPVTDWHNARERALDRAQERRLQILDPRTIPDDLLGEATGKRVRISSRSYGERRALGLCYSCEAPSPKFARCDRCRTRYNGRASRSSEYMRAVREKYAAGRRARRSP